MNIRFPEPITIIQSKSELTAHLAHAQMDNDRQRWGIGVRESMIILYLFDESGTAKELSSNSDFGFVLR